MQKVTSTKCVHIRAHCVENAAAKNRRCAECKRTTQFMYTEQACENKRAVLTAAKQNNAKMLPCSFARIHTFPHSYPWTHSLPLTHTHSFNRHFKAQISLAVVAVDNLNDDTIIGGGVVVAF